MQVFLLFCLFIIVSNEIAVSALGPPLGSPFGGVGVGSVPKKCEPSLTTASGSYVNNNKATFCSGDLIFEDTFDTFDMRKWEHENTLAGGGNWEFQWYTNNRSNSFCEEGFLHLRPTLTADVYGESFLSSGQLSIHGGSIADYCTNPSNWGCERAGTTTHLLNPIRSSSLRTIRSFSFKYGKVEVSAKLPSGDWLSPAIWFLPRDNVYGQWPSSGEIDLVESRGNRDLLQNGLNIGNEQISSTLHFGPYAELDGWPTSHYNRNAVPGNAWSNDIHRYQMEWTPEKITFSVDDVETGTIKANNKNGFWSRGGFDTSAPGTDNPWRLGTSMAPFDQEFYMIINLAIGGTSYFPDDAENGSGGNSGKPWTNKSPTAAADFWNARNLWLPTWNLEENLSREASLIVDYVRIWAL